MMMFVRALQVRVRVVLVLVLDLPLLSFLTYIHTVLSSINQNIEIALRVRTRSLHTRSTVPVRTVPYRTSTHRPLQKRLEREERGAVRVKAVCRVQQYGHGY